MTQEQTERLLKNYSNARKSWEGWCYLNNVDLESNNHKISLYASENELLLHTRYLLCKDYHIELSKILKETWSTGDNIFKFLRESDAERAKDALDQLEAFAEVIKSITDARDKFYAHLDEDYANFLGGFKVNDYEQTFYRIEQAIMALGKESELREILAEIPSRNDFVLDIS